MKPFLATLVFQISVDQHNGPAQFDEQVRLILAEDLLSAWDKAREKGNKDEDHFLNHLGHQVAWTFISVTDVFPLHSVTDGGQVYSITHEADNAGIFIDQIRERSKAAASFAGRFVSAL